MNENQKETVSYKPFDLQECITKYGGRCVTRDGRSARVICTDRKGFGLFREIVALVHEPVTDSEGLRDYGRDGRYDEDESEADLFLPVKFENRFIVVPNVTRKFDDRIGVEIYCQENRLNSDTYEILQVVTESPV